jgi:hypothetical protein
MVVIAAVFMAGLGSGCESGTVVVIASTADRRLPERELHLAALEEWRPRGTECLPETLAAETAIDAEAGAFATAAGTFIIGNGRTNEIVAVSTASDARGTIMGRKGRGPGEFERLAWTGLYKGDTIISYDSYLRRITAMTMAGEVQWVRTIPALGDSDSVVVTGIAGALDNGDIVVIGKRPGRLAAGRHRNPVMLFQWNPQTGALSSIATAAGDEVQLDPLGGEGFAFLPPLFRRSTIVRTHGNTTWIVNTEHFELVGTSAAHDSITIAVNWPLRKVRRGDVAQALRGVGLTNKGVGRDVNRLLREYAPSYMPAISDVHVDARGRLWVLPYDNDARTAHTWLVFDSSGTPLAKAVLPVHTVTHIGSSRVIVRQIGVDDVVNVCGLTMDAL